MTSQRSTVISNTLKGDDLTGRVSTPDDHHQVQIRIFPPLSAANPSPKAVYPLHTQHSLVWSWFGRVDGRYTRLSAHCAREHSGWRKGAQKEKWRRVLWVLESANREARPAPPSFNPTSKLSKHPPPTRPPPMNPSDMDAGCVVAPR